MNRQALAFTVIPAVAIPVGLVLMRPARWDAMHVTGLALAMAGIALVTLARAQLGNAFSITPQARTLVTTGLYSRIRNPVYVFGAMAIAGFTMYAGMPRPLLVVFLILIPVQVLRVRAESRKLEEKFGEDYRAWRRQTWF